MATSTAPAAVQARVEELLRSGDVSAAATAALRGHGPEILRFLRSILRDEDDAADAFSHFAENLWRGLSAFRGQSSLRTWAFRIAWNAARTLRHDAWHRKGRRFATGEASRIAEDIRTKTAVRVERQRDELEALRQGLTAEDQTLLALRLDREFTWRRSPRCSRPGARRSRPSPS